MAVSDMAPSLSPCNTLAKQIKRSLRIEVIKEEIIFKKQDSVLTWHCQQKLANSVNNCHVKHNIYIIMIFLHHSLISDATIMKTIIQSHSYKPADNIASLASTFPALQFSRIVKTLGQNYTLQGQPTFGKYTIIFQLVLGITSAVGWLWQSNQRE